MSEHRKVPEDALPPHLRGITGDEAREKGVYNEIAQAYQQAGVCVFCYLGDEYFLTQSPDGLAVLRVNAFPRNRGDLMVVPTRHVIEEEDLTNQEVLAARDLRVIGKRLLEEMGKPGTYTILRQGRDTDRSVEHLHYNVIPFRQGMISWQLEEGLSPLNTALQFRETLERIKNGS